MFFGCRATCHHHIAYFSPIGAAIVIIICSLLLLAYLFDISATRTRIPAVVLLLLLGWIVKQAVRFTGTEVPSLTPLLPVLGTIGLILIVLEGALDLEINRSRKAVIIRAFFAALIPIALLSLGLAWFLSGNFGYSFRQSLLNVIPLCVISSSVAISAGRTLDYHGREFVIYESSLSDILGVLFFNFVAINQSLGAAAIGDFSLKLLLIIAVSFVATLLLSYMLKEINHRIKFAPIILLVILIYELSKIYHLPGLLFILLFGLFVGNLDELKHVRWISRLRPENLDLELRKFRDITTEATFIIRSLFFLLFGFLIETKDLLNLDTLRWSLLMVAAIVVVRALALKITRTPLLPYIFLAPRGLITILLYFAIDPAEKIGVVNNSLVLQVIMLSALLLMTGMLLTKKTAAPQAGAGS